MPKKFRSRNLRQIAEMVVGDVNHFPYRSSRYITEFFEECDLGFAHDGSTRWAWTAARLAELLTDPTPQPHMLPSRFVHVLRVLMHRSEAAEGDPDRALALDALNQPLSREGFEAFYGDDGELQIRHTGSAVISATANPHRPFTEHEAERRRILIEYVSSASEDDLTEVVLLPLFRQLGFQRVTFGGHRDKSLEYGKDVWMRYVLPTLHVLYFGLQVKKGKLDAAGSTRMSNANIAEVHNQVLMMLGHEIFDPETSRRVLVDHAIIVAGGEITKAARNWLGGKLDATKRSQVLFMERDDIVNLFATSNLPLPDRAVEGADGPDESFPF